jgi:hypothetical protein
MPRHNALCNFWIVNLVQERLLSVFWVTLLGNSVTRTTNLYKLLDVNSSLLRCRLDGRFFGLLGGPPGEVTLMLLALCVGQVASLVVVQGQAQLALICTQMVPHKVGILLKINSFCG